MNLHLEILSVALVVSAACSLPGTFLVLRRKALISDAISHAVLPGIVIGFFATGNLNSPLLIVGATIAGVLTALLSDLLSRTRLLKEDAAIGLVFPLFFSVGVLLISRYSTRVHLDTDAVLLGELAFAPFRRLFIGGVDLGPQAFWSMLSTLACNAGFLLLFFKELKISTFDPGLAHVFRLRPALVNHLLMLMVSLTVVSAFDAAGSILVVALIVTPAATAWLLSNRLEGMVALSLLFGVLSALCGYGMASLLDVSIAGSMAVFCGLIFSLVVVFAPGKGLASQRLQRKTETINLGVRMLLVHLSHHIPGAERENEHECHRDHLTEHINWTPAFATRVVDTARSRKLVTENNSVLYLTPGGFALAKEVMTQ